MKKPKVLGATLLAVAMAAGCTTAQVDAFMMGMAAASAATSGSSSGWTKLMLFGGKGHDIYLGCLNCSSTATDSVTNSYGSFGSSYSSTSIFNAYSQFGSRYSDYSACNPYASDPPVIVDQQGRFYGRLTMNRYYGQVTSDQDVLRWLEAVCR